MSAEMRQKRDAILKKKHKGQKAVTNPSMPGNNSKSQFPGKNKVSVPGKDGRTENAY